MAKPNQIKDRTKFQTFPAGGGASSLGSEGASRFATLYPEAFAVVVGIDDTDANNNGGRDSNGYYVCFLRNSEQYQGTYDVEMRLATGGNVEVQSAIGYKGGDSVWGYVVGQTSNSPNPDDDGFVLVTPLAGYYQVLRTYDNDSYPHTNGGCYIFPVRIQGLLSYDDSTCTNSLSTSDSTGTNSYVYNLAGQYIPSNSLVIGFPIYSDGSTLTHFLCEYWGELAEDLDFSLTANLAITDSTVTSYSVISWNNGYPINDTTPTIDNMPDGAGGYIFSGASGNRGWATRLSNGHYMIRQMWCGSPG